MTDKRLPNGFNLEIYFSDIEGEEFYKDEVMHWETIYKILERF